MGKRMLRGWQGLKAGRGVESGRWGGWTGRRGDSNGEVETGRGNLRGQRGGGQCEEEMERGAVGKVGGRWEGGNGKGGKMKEVGMGRGKIRGKRRGDFTDGYDGMPGWT